MQSKITMIMKKLGSKKITDRKKAIKEIARYLHHREGYMARLSLHYISEHDPSFSVRNLAKQAFYRIGSPPTDCGSWERTYGF